MDRHTVASPQQVDLGDGPRAPAAGTIETIDTMIPWVLLRFCSLEPAGRRADARTAALSRMAQQR